MLDAVAAEAYERPSATPSDCRLRAALRVLAGEVSGRLPVSLSAADVERSAPMPRCRCPDSGSQLPTPLLRPGNAPPAARVLLSSSPRPLLTRTKAFVDAKDGSIYSTRKMPRAEKSIVRERPADSTNMTMVENENEAEEPAPAADAPGKLYVSERLRDSVLYRLS